MAARVIELTRVLVALVVAALAFLQIIRIEWFDVLRWGPPSGRLGSVYVVTSVLAGLLGWSVAAALTSDAVWRRLGLGKGISRH